jgi:hypothetical protein
MDRCTLNLEGLRKREDLRFTEWLPECSCYATYMVERNWDSATYMRHAEIGLYRDKVENGYALSPSL